MTSKVLLALVALVWQTASVAGLAWMAQAPANLNTLDILGHPLVVALLVGIPSFGFGALTNYITTRVTLGFLEKRIAGAEQKIEAHAAETLTVRMANQREHDQLAAQQKEISAQFVQVMKEFSSNERTLLALHARFDKVNRDMAANLAETIHALGEVEGKVDSVVEQLRVETREALGAARSLVLARQVVDAKEQADGICGPQQDRD